MFDPTRPCDSFNRKKFRYSKKELDDLRYTYNIILPEDNMTISQICNFYKTLDWKKLKKKKEIKWKKIEESKKKKKLEMEKKKHAAFLKKKQYIEMKKKYMKKEAEYKLKKKKQEEEKALQQEKKIKEKKQEQETWERLLSRQNFFFCPIVDL